MKAWINAAIFCAVLGNAAHCGAAEFSVKSADGVEIRGAVSDGRPSPLTAVIFVPGTGLFDRDANLGETGTPRDLIFKDLAQRMEARGVVTVRYDTRGVRYGALPEDYLDRALILTRSTTAMADDVAAIYEWAKSAAGLNARCVAFFAHSEGMLHVARLADRGAPPPDLVIGMGAAMSSPVEAIRWQITERDAASLEMMDADRDGVTTNDEVRANWQGTPTGANRKLDPLLHPNGTWRKEDLAELRAGQRAFYETLKNEALAMADSDPFPSSDTPSAPYEWWKSWFTDHRSAAERLARWPTPVSLHYGDKDSQVVASEAIALSRSVLDASRLKTQVHPGRGHTLGEDVLFGPTDEAIAERIAEEAAGLATACRG